jgi:hypothetical protein
MQIGRPRTDSGNASMFGAVANAAAVVTWSGVSWQYWW